MPRRVRAYVGLGSNLGDAAATLAAAVRALDSLQRVRVAGVSRLYASAPVGVTDQPEFRNAVVAVDVIGDPEPVRAAVALLVELKRLERAFGRRPRGRWGPREIDLDLLVFGRQRISVERPAKGVPIDLDQDPSKAGRLLVVPHPEAAERLFVLAPLADLAPGLVPPGWRETVETARRRRVAIEGADAVRPVARWDGAEWAPADAAPADAAPADA